MKKIFKSEWFLLWIPAAMFILGLWALNDSPIGLIAFVLLGVLSAANALWHSLDKDVEIED